MPSRTTRQEIITFVIHFATAKNELDKVAPLVRALAGAARIREGRIVVPRELRTLAIELYPGVARMLGFMERAGSEEASLNTAPEGHCDEVSCRVCLSYSSTQMLIASRIRSHLSPARGDSHQILRATWIPRKMWTSTSPHVSAKGSQRRTCTAAWTRACRPSKTRMCA